MVMWQFCKIESWILVSDSPVFGSIRVSNNLVGSCEHTVYNLKGGTAM